MKPKGMYTNINEEKLKVMEVLNWMEQKKAPKTHIVSTE